MTINKYGLEMEGLKAAATATKELSGYYSGRYMEVLYNTETGEIRMHEHVGHGSWTDCSGTEWIRVGNLYTPTSMQRIADAIREAVAFRREQP